MNLLIAKYKFAISNTIQCTKLSSQTFCDYSIVYLIDHLQTYLFTSVSPPNY